MNGLPYNSLQLHGKDRYIPASAHVKGKQPGATTEVSGRAEIDPVAPDDLFKGIARRQKMDLPNWRHTLPPVRYKDERLNGRQLVAWVLPNFVGANLTDYVARWIRPNILLCTKSALSTGRLTLFMVPAHKNVE
jgi:hypothetical protein